MVEKGGIIGTTEVTSDDPILKATIGKNYTFQDFKNSCVGLTPEQIEKDWLAQLGNIALSDKEWRGSTPVKGMAFVEQDERI
ncbi:MAG: hypothetical protein M1142_04725 [Patescibacteria group bacterium]|nr:hypothetical protein [Patescibacteria group bacterium]